MRILQKGQTEQGWGSAEDEAGVVNVVLRPEVFTAYREVLRSWYRNSSRTANHFAHQREKFFVVLIAK
jgi:hypothetical protein